MKGILSIIWLGVASLGLSPSIVAKELKRTALSSKQPGRFDPTIEDVLLHMKNNLSSMCWEKFRRPVITLAFAQTLDGKIALYLDDLRREKSSNFPISGPASLLLTHALRSVHDAILIGGRTLLSDNPRLTNRLWKDASFHRHQPRPVVLDSELKHVNTLFQSDVPMKASNVIVCCSKAAKKKNKRLSKLVTLLACNVDQNGRLDLKSVIHNLRHKFQIKSIMVEGGASIITAFLQEALVDCLCITIAPKIIGNNGVPAILNKLENHVDKNIEFSAIELKSVKHFSLEEDCIFLSFFH